MLSRIDSTKKQIISTYKSGPGYVTDTYQWNGSTFIKKFGLVQEVSTTPVLSNETANWKTYVNSEMGYSISYPPTYHPAYDNDLLNFDENKYENGNSAGVKIQIQKTSGNLNASKADVPTIKYYEKVTSGPGGTFDIYSVTSINGTKYFQVLVWGIENDNQNVSKILSTFNFISTTPKKPNTGSVSNWKTYISTQYGFSIQYPTGTQITDTGISGGRNIIFTTSQGVVMVGIVTQAWHNGVLSSPPNCDDTASGADRTNTSINGVNFITFNISKEMSGMNSPTSATEYCVIQNGTAYKLITRVGYIQDFYNGLDLDKNPTLNQMLSTFKFTK